MAYLPYNLLSELILKMKGILILDFCYGVLSDLSLMLFFNSWYLFIIVYIFKINQIIYPLSILLLPLHFI